MDTPVGGTEWVLTAVEKGDQVKKFKNEVEVLRGAAAHLDRSDNLRRTLTAFHHTRDIKLGS